MSVVDARRTPTAAAAGNTQFSAHGPRNTTPAHDAQHRTTGSNVDVLVPRNFWTRVAGKYGTKFYWQNNGEEAAIEAAVNAIDVCLREPVGVGQCTTLA